MRTKVMAPCKQSDSSAPVGADALQWPSCVIGSGCRLGFILMRAALEGVRV